MVIRERIPTNWASPLKAAGGCHKTSKLLVSVRPNGIKEIREPFCNSAAFTLTAKRAGIAEHYWINDIDPDFVNYWTVVRDHVGEFVELATKLHAEHGLGSEEFFFEMKSLMDDEDKVTKAVALWMVNRLVRGGATHKAGFNKSYLKDGRGIKQSYINRHFEFSRLLEGVKITNLDYAEVMNADGEGVLNYLDAPYADKGSQVYRFGEIDMDAFFANIDACDHNVLLTINNSEEMRQRTAKLNGYVYSYKSGLCDAGDKEKTEIFAANYTNRFYHKYLSECAVSLIEYVQPASNDNRPEKPSAKKASNDNRSKKSKTKQHVKDLFLNRPGLKRSVEAYSPQDFLDHLYAANRNQPFDVDPCSPCKGGKAPVNAKTHYTREDDGLVQDWFGTVYVNGPYENLAPWVEKAADSVWCKSMGNAPTVASGKRRKPKTRTVVMLLPARTHTRYWEKYIKDHAKVFFITGKMKFRNFDENGNLVHKHDTLPHGLALVIWGDHERFTKYFEELGQYNGHVFYDRSHPSIPNLPVEYWKRVGRQKRAKELSGKHDFDTDVIHHHSCADMKHLSNDSIGLTVTSVPYNVGIDYGSVQDNLDWDTYWNEKRQIAEELFRVTEDGGRVAINVAETAGTTKYPLAHMWTELMIQTGFKSFGRINWVKCGVKKQSTQFGSYCRASAPNIREEHEPILLFYKGDEFKREKYSSVESCSRGTFLSATVSNWFLRPESRKDDGHPAPFRVDLPSRLIELLSGPDDVILDPFMGSGTTAIAALAHGRKFVGYELDKKFANDARERIASADVEIAELKINGVIPDPDRFWVGMSLDTIKGIELPITNVNAYNQHSVYPAYQSNSEYNSFKDFLGRSLLDGNGKTECENQHSEAA
ncbi:DNA N-6-adenine-methyltransferase [Terasakiella sp. A23]|uniref:DNA N-6-adenine-methyltransferase n=1 Tax=Terasakiella sp. FCG-A23 TaxID=3080561 RepID=UPI00295589B9|nr:DNA N-6-adenine-methyltransferase [Terasakiella sp. A23]MDV7341568.1 DNA N-6-adenine-methyltransferase [Terasakiella sp. A23]